MFLTNIIYATQSERLTTILERSKSNDPEMSRIDLINMRIDDNEAIALAEALKNNSVVKILDLFRNRIGDRGAMAFAELFQNNHTLEKVYFWGARMGEDGIEALVKALENNFSITELGVNDDRIRSILQRNRRKQIEDLIDSQPNKPIEEYVIAAQYWVYSKNDAEKEVSHILKTRQSFEA